MTLPAGLPGEQTTTMRVFFQTSSGTWFQSQAKLRSASALT